MIVLKPLCAVAALLMLLVSCSPTAQQTTMSLEFIHLEQAQVFTTVPLRTLGVARINAERPAFIVYSLKVGIEQYFVDDLLSVFEAGSMKKVVLTQNEYEQLSSLSAELKKQYCGQVLAWEQAGKVLERFDTAEVVDIETGLFFEVQRRGGSYHADVQPLTRNDTATMRKIYGGVWSWDRRAVLVKVDGQCIAASMNGMPHGKGALTNGFPGHFCIHFIGSTTHATHSLDLGHQLMIRKAAGEIWSLAREATPEQQVRNFTAAINQKDWWLAQLFALPISTADLEHLFANVETIEVDQVVLNSPVGESCQVNVLGEVIFRGGSRSKYAGSVRVQMYADVWKVDSEGFTKIIK